MASFDDLPAEVVHHIAQLIAPRCCEDSKQDILAFRAVQKRTWHIANQIAFKYMTLPIYDPSCSSTLGIFGRQAKADALGYDIRDCVKEVRYLLRPRLRLLQDLKEVKLQKFYRETAFEAFSLLLNKQAQDLDATERRARQHYWELCFKPYMVPLPSDSTIVSRIEKDLAGFSNLQTMFTDSKYHLLNTSSIAWQALQDIGISDRIWDESQRRFHQIRIGVRGRYVMDVEQLHSTLLAAMPPSVTTLRGENFAKVQRPLTLDRTSRQKFHQQITEIDAVLHQQTPENNFLRFRDAFLVLASLKTLRLRSGTTRPDQCQECIFRLTMLTRKFRKYSFNTLQTLHLSGYAMSSAEFLHSLEFAAHHNLELNLENMVLVGTDMRVSQDFSSSLTALAQDRWQFLPRLAELARFRLQDHLYNSRFRVRVQGDLTYLPVRGADISHGFWEQTISGAALALFENLLRMEGQEEVFVEEVEKAPLSRVREDISHTMYFDIIYNKMPLA